MVKLNQRAKFLILIVVFVATGWFCLQPLDKIGTDKSYVEEKIFSHKLTQKELDDFLNLWQQIQQGPLREYIAQISLHSQETYPRPIVKWLEANNWNAERFFYDEQRLQDVLSCVNLRKIMNANIETSKKTGTNLKDIITAQKEAMKACLFESEEMSLIEQNREHVRAVFEKHQVDE